MMSFCFAEYKKLNEIFIDLKRILFVYIEKRDQCIEVHLYMHLPSSWQEIVSRLLLICLFTAQCLFLFSISI